MSFLNPLLISQQILAALGTRVFTHYQDRIPQAGSMLIVSNHRSIMDAPVLMSAVNRPIRFACHHYMSQVPVMRDLVTRFGALPLDAPEERHKTFFHQATHLLQTRQAIGIFPEGTEPMVQKTSPEQMGDFHRGFAHLALRAPVQDLAVLPVAIASHEELNTSLFPVKLLHLFDPSEPLFDQGGWHPFVMYQRVTVLVGRPVWISSEQQRDYQGKLGRSRVTKLTEQCHSEIQDLLRQGAWS